MISATDINFKNISLEEFNIINNDIKKDKKQYVSFSDYKVTQGKYNSNIYGIFVNDNLTGMFCICTIWNHPAIRLAILNEYRGKNIAGLALEKILEDFGKLYPEIECFYSEVNPFNKKAMRVMEKHNWQRNYDYDYIIYNEGAEFVLFSKDNPYYLKQNEIKGGIYK